MGKRREDYLEAAPHEDKLRKYRIGRWVTNCRLAKNWTMVDVAMRLHASFPHSHLGNQGRISELETGNGVKRERWTPEILHFLYSIFQPCPPLPADPWAYSDEYEKFLREQERKAEAKRRAEEARRMAELARRQKKPQLGMDLLWEETEDHRLEQHPA
jgi:transcriptional regulator with XRE-family HTH domain